MRKVIEYLIQAGGKKKECLEVDNPYKEIGFDSEKPRLGWVKIPSWIMIKNLLTKCLEFIKDKEKFIFVGMGGSINGVKTLSFLNGKFIYPLDSLDPFALKEVLDKIDDFKKVFVIAISKSGTTKETQLIALTLKEAISCKLYSSSGKSNNWRKHFLWLTDSESFENLNSLGWEGVPKLPIQVDGGSDIGGRFSSPHTLVFLLPLFLILGKDFNRLKEIYDSYLSLRGDILNKAYDLAHRYKNLPHAYFAIKVKNKLLNNFSTWLIQLFQESLGSKKKNFGVKTIVVEKIREDSFYPLSLYEMIENPISYVMLMMSCLQYFVAFYSYFKKINFVNQPFVEEYKRKMKILDREGIVSPQEVNLKKLIEEVGRNINPNHKFIEIVLYFYPQRSSLIAEIAREFGKKFPSKKIFVFLGSDWNHHSYQSAFWDEETLYVLLISRNYTTHIPFISKESLENNIDTLKKISFATFITLKNKSLYFSLDY